MALSASTVWEVRSATGADTNGGGFVTGAAGTDYSQQTSPQYTTAIATTAGTTTITWTAAASDMVGNIIYVVGGTGSIVAGWYQVISVSVGASIVVDRSTGLTTGTGVTVNLGGALATLTQALSPFVSGNTIYCTGSQTVTTTVSISTAGSNTALPNQIIGYGSTRTDGTQFTLQTATNSVNLVTFQSGAGDFLFKNILFKCTAGTPALGVTGASFINPTQIIWDNCRFTGFTYGIYGVYANISPNPQYVEFLLTPVLINCEIDHCTASGLYTSTSFTCIGCYFHDNTAYGINTLNAGQHGQGLHINSCVFYNNGLGGIDVADNTPITVINSAFVSNTGSGIIYSGTGIILLTCINNIFYGNSTYGINVVIAILGFFKNNAFGSNTSGATHGLSATQEGTLTLTADPFNGRTSGDFTLNSTAGGGAVLKAAGWQSTII